MRGEGYVRSSSSSPSHLRQIDPCPGSFPSIRERSLWGLFEAESLSVSI